MDMAISEFDIFTKSGLFS